MRKELFWNPRLLCERICERVTLSSQRRGRLSKLKGTPAQGLNPGYIDSLELLELIKSELSPKIIYDVGACIGTWSLLAKAIFPEASVHAFEPVGAHIRKFSETTKRVPDIVLHEVALGFHPGVFNINITNPSHSSSFLDVTEAALEDYNVANTPATAPVKVEAMDKFITQQRLPFADLIKLDVQGYELEVLRGGTACLERAGWVLSEVSFREYFKGQPLFHEVVSFLYKRNFQLYAFGLNTPLGAKLTQADALFKRVP